MPPPPPPPPEDEDLLLFPELADVTPGQALGAFQALTPAPVARQTLSRRKSRASQGSPRVSLLPCRTRQGCYMTLRALRARMCVRLHPFWFARQTALVCGSDPHFVCGSDCLALLGIACVL
jgi:hypothetical protein